MSEVLSQSEIDALLSALTKGEVKAEDIREEAASTRVRTYDFRRAMRFSKDHIRIISRIHEHFARLMTTYLSGQLRSVVQIQVESVDQVPYEEFIRSIPILTVIELLAFHPLPGKIVMEINPQIVFAIIDRMMGGVVQGPYKERELTEIEQALMRPFLEQTEQFFRESWHNVVDLQPEFLSVESNPQFLQLSTPNETVLVITLSARVGPVTGLINLCVPHVTIEPIMHNLSTQFFMDGLRDRESSSAEQMKLANHMQGMEVSMAVALGQAELTVRDVLELQVGDMIPLNHPISAPVTVYVDEVPTFTARIGKMRGKMAIRILREWKEEADHERSTSTLPGRN
ncbi:flagellar motor switch protein FliM [Alicyclobacillus sp. TC]|uniref:Flagellar motor switch protein FliM n=1 Tax=Alicyclobacillus tolerans TaxID=90970 RepID=A0A1M6RPI2_9BACL|nr:flagellar motor switch protein FliM [Alicyclobacillus sp. TC]SHK34300.1 flagellar motor switch protein FliM [Alicyclobacillus montanus]